MGQGIELAKLAGGGAQAELIENLKEQLLIVFLKRLVDKDDGQLRVPVAEVDATGSHSLALHVEGKDFVFTLKSNKRN